MTGGTTYVIAEAGVNHDGLVHRAIELADEAKAAGADAVKFQTFRAEDVVTPSARTAEYQRTNTGATSQFDMIKALELDEAGHRQVATHCKRIGIEFFSTPFSHAAVDMLVQLGVRRLKLPSGEITNKPLIQHAAATRLPLLVSTGMSTLDEVRIAAGWIEEAWGNSGRPGGEAPLVLLHCTSAYPPPPDALNLRAIATLAQAFGVPVGYSDHSVGIEAAIAAVALGARVIEKHLTLDKRLPGPDHRASADPQEFAAMVRGIRTVERMLGDGVKRPQAVEFDTREVARRSVVSARALSKGDRLKPGDLALRRPGTGIPPDALPDVVGRRLAQDLPADETLQWSMLEGD